MQLVSVFSPIDRLCDRVHPPQFTITTGSWLQLRLGPLIMTFLQALGPRAIRGPSGPRAK